MEDQKCYFCGKDSAKLTIRYVKIAEYTEDVSKIEGNLNVNTVSTTERFAGVDRVSICNKCKKKKRRAGKILGAIVAFVIFIIGCVCMFPLISNVPEEMIPIVVITDLIIGLALAVFMFIFISRKGKIQYIIAHTLENKANGDNNFDKDVDRKNRETTYKVKAYRFIPVDRSLYSPKGVNGPDPEFFKKQVGLNTDIYKAIFDKFIADDKGIALIDEMIDKSQIAHLPDNPY